jgi:hypothetical protein
MTTTCQNCHAALHGNYCSECGQSADTHRINVHFLWHDVQHGLLHMDKGIFFTAKELFTRPGHSIRSFLEGRRVQHFRPISLVLVLAGIYGFLSHYFHINMLANNVEVHGSGEQFNRIKEVIATASEWIAGHYAIVALVQIPVFATGTFIAFYKARYNYIEHLVINAFLTGQRLLLHLVAFPLYYIFNGTAGLRTTARVVDMAGYVLMAWALIQLFNSFTIGQRIWRTILALAISLLITFLLLTAVFMLVVNSVK